MKTLSAKAEAASARREGPPARADVRHLIVDEASGTGQRLDNFLVRHCKGVPKSHIYQLIRSGQVRVNGKRCKADDRLAEGDAVRVPPMRLALGPGGVAGGATGPEAGNATAYVPPAEFPVVFEDEALLVVDKPPGVAVHGGSGVAHGVIERLRAARPQARFLELAHRLDRETSGVLLLGKKRAALLSLHQQLRERLTDKRYVAIVLGRWPLRTKTVRFPLLRYLTLEGERRVRVQVGGQEAVSRVTGLQHVELAGLGLFTLLEVRLETGRTHQIRVHLAHSGFPIVGDDKYGDFELNRLMQRAGFRRMFLHARSIELHHPVDGRPLRLCAAMPAEFQAMLDRGVAPARAAGPRDPDIPEQGSVEEQQ